MWNPLFAETDLDDLLRKMGHLQEGLSQFFSQPQAGMLVDFPAVNVWSSPETLWVSAELPGIDPKELDITIVGETLTLRGHRPPEDPKDRGRYLRRERMHGQFARTVQLPCRVRTEQVSARYKHGILWITLPRADGDRPRKIAVTGS